jgi:hypoxanthine phosphoribosyltransferase
MIKKQDIKEHPDGTSDDSNCFYYHTTHFCEDRDILVDMIKKSHLEKPFDIVLGIARGGLTLAKHIYAELKISTFMVIQLQSYTNQKQSEIKIIKEPPWDELKNKRLLIVDDLIDNGKTIHFLKQLLLEKGMSNFKFAVLIDKQKNPEINADFCARYLDEWVVFFWEKEYNILDE